MKRCQPEFSHRMTDDLAKKKKRNSFDDADMMVNQTSSLPPGIAIFLSALNFVLSITAFVGNTLILVALYKVPSIHPPTKLLFRCLSVTDLCVGLYLQPLFATRILNSATKIISPGNLFYFIAANSSLSFILCGVSGLTSTAITLDRLLALTGAGPAIQNRCHVKTSCCTNYLFLVDWYFVRNDGLFREL